MPGFHTSGTGIWLASDLSGANLAEPHTVETIMNGTLILPWAEFFATWDEAAMEKVAEMDVALAEQGLLPEIGKFPYGF